MVITILDNVVIAILIFVALVAIARPGIYYRKVNLISYGIAILINILEVFIIKYFGISGNINERITLAIFIFFIAISRDRMNLKFGRCKNKNNKES